MQTRQPLDRIRRGRILAGLIGIVVSVIYTVMAFHMPVGTRSAPGPGVFPRGVGIMAIIISVILVVEAYFSGVASGTFEFPKGKKRTLVIVFSLATIGYVVLLPVLGQYVGSSLYMIVMLKTLSKLNLVKVIAYGLAIAIPISWVFLVVLEIPLPRGIL